MAAAPFNPPGSFTTQWGDSGAINAQWVPPTSLLGTPNHTHGTEHLVAVVVSMTLGWIVFALIVRQLLDKKKFSSEYVSRVASFTHSTLATLYCGYNLYLRYRQSLTNETFINNMVCLNEPPLADEQYAAAFIASYFLYDTIGLFVGDYFDAMYLVHHAGSLSVLLTSVFYQELGIEVSFGIILLEITGPFLHARWLLNEHQWYERYPKSKLWAFIEYAYLALFFVARTVLGNALVIFFSPVYCEKTPYHAAFVLAAIFIYSSIFLVGTVKQIMRGEKWVA